jgi:hypothetical protein
MENLTQEELYYDKGYFVSKISNEISALLWNEIYTTEWVADRVENIYKQIPSWYLVSDYPTVTGQNRGQIEREVGQTLLDRTPETLKYVGSKITTLPELQFFNTYYRRYNLEFIDMWNGSEEIPYHFDSINGSDTLILIYLTEQTYWQKEWGGQISLKKQVGESIIVEDTFNPITGTMLVINNANPLVKHKITKLKNNDVNRYTFSFYYKWF